MNKKTKILISIAVMIFMICAVNVSFVKAESKVIKVGYIDYPGFIQKMDDGSYEGYGVEYLNESTITGHMSLWRIHGSRL